jgi:hypothetical protein
MIYLKGCGEVVLASAWTDYEKLRNHSTYYVQPDSDPGPFTVRSTLEHDFQSYCDYLQYKHQEVSVLRRGSARAISSGRPLIKCRLGTRLSHVSSGGVGWDDGFPATAQN